MGPWCHHEMKPVDENIPSHSSIMGRSSFPLVSRCFASDLCRWDEASPVIGWPIWGGWGVRAGLLSSGVGSPALLRNWGRSSDVGEKGDWGRPDRLPDNCDPLPGVLAHPRPVISDVCLRVGAQLPDPYGAEHRPAGNARHERACPAHSRRFDDGVGAVADRGPRSVLPRHRLRG
jgi:hypothetical protein